MLWSVDQTPYGRSCKHPMVGRPQTLWSVDQATFEWNGPKTESSVNDFLHKRAKMCNSDFLDCKLKSQKFNYRFDSISWFYVTLWHQKIQGQVNILIYAAPYCSSGHGPVPVLLYVGEITNRWISYREIHIKENPSSCPIPEKRATSQSCQGSPSGLHPPVTPGQL